MAEAAKPTNAVSKEAIEAFLDRFEGLEDEALDIMMEAMRVCKDGPRAKQKELLDEIKAAGVRKKTFKALWKQRDYERKAREAISGLEDDDLDQMREFATAMAGTPMGDLISARLDEADFS
ncbi:MULTISPECIES: hypothetical protein [unclassified Bradyrhizobium]|uniref:hypothetical protein n=1 Tax=unclassified Bradyrhizobium TaxID=2631580 RepID=UPI002915C5B1|nr:MULTISPECIES: hypothetical protein [unclassified Bradyrhizobium]